MRATVLGALCLLAVEENKAVGANEQDPTTFDFSLAADCPEGPVPGDYAFTASVDGCEPGDALVYCWDFDGDGVADATTTEPQCTRHYETHGAKSVTLTVSNDTRKVSKTLTFENLLRLLPKRLLVVNGNPGAAFPYDTWENAAADVQTAIDAAVDGCEVVLSNGVYAVKTLSATVTIAKGVTVRGLTGRPEDVRIDATENNVLRVVRLNHAEAVLSGVAVGFTKKPTIGSYCMPICFDAGGGQVTNCVIRNGFAQDVDPAAAAVYMASADALVTHCVISNCCQLRSSNGRGAIYGNGRLSNCLVVGNSAEAASEAVVMLTNSGSMENCTFADNEAHGDTISHVNLYSADTRVANCVLALNTSVGTTALRVKGSGAFVNCVSDFDVLTAGRDNVVAASDKIFADALHGNWSPKPKGPLVDAGRADLVEPTDSDLAGSRRIVGDEIDVGAYELDTEKFSASFAADRTEAAVPAEIGLSVALTGCDDGDDIRFCWDFDGDGTTDEVWTTPDGTHNFDVAGWADVFLTVSNLTKNASATCGSAGFLYLVPSVLRVVADNPGAAFPYDTWENAAADVQTAVDAAVDGCEVVLSNGVYAVKTISSTLTIAKGVTVRGLTGRPEDVRIDATERNVLRVVRLDHAKAVLSGVAVGFTKTPGNNSYCMPICFDVGGGQVTNCVIRNGFAQDSDPAAAAVYMASADALVTHCVISNCCQLRSNGRGAIYGNGRLSNCLVVGNSAEAASEAVVMLTNSGSMENCTFADNEAHGDTISHVNLYSADTRVANCVLARNTSVGTSALHVKGSGTYVNCVSDVDVQNPGVLAVDEAIFADAAHGDWSPKPKGPLVDTGRSDVVELTDSDLAGSRRIVGDEIDVGAYELDPEKFSASFAADRTEAAVPAEIGFSVALTGCDDGDDVRFCWDFDGDGTTDEVWTDPEGSHDFDVAGWADVFLTVSNLTKNVSATRGSARFLYLVPPVLRVSNGNPGAAFPYDTWENAAADVQTAIDAAVDGCEVVLSNGVYAVKTLSATVTIAKGVTVRGLTGRPEDVRIDATENNVLRVVRIDHAKAVLSGVAVGFTKKPTNASYSMPIYFDTCGGQVTNCIIRNGFAQDSDPAAAAVYMASADALVTHCVISNCCQLRSNGRGAIYGNGRLSNCLVVGNSTEAASEAVVMLTNSGSMENCTFVENEVAGSGLHLKLAATCGVRNSIFAANLKDAASGFAFTDVPACFSCCLSDITWLGGESQGRKASAAEVFNDPKRPWHLRPGSPAVNVVPASEVGALASVDLGGHARLVGGKLDLGCYECQSRGMMLMVR